DAVLRAAARRPRAAGARWAMGPARARDRRRREARRPEGRFSRARRRRGRFQTGSSPVSDALLEIDHLRKAFGGLEATDDVSLEVQATEPHSFRFWQAAEKIPRLRQPAQQLLSDVGLTSHGDAIASTMSHGQHRQIELGMALATKPIMLLLDEPMAGLGIEES